MHATNALSKSKQAPFPSHRHKQLIYNLLQPRFSDCIYPLFIDSFHKIL